VAACIVRIPSLYLSDPDAFVRIAQQISKVSALTLLLYNLVSVLFPNICQFSTQQQKEVVLLLHVL
jgi:hypothetical protein